MSEPRWVARCADYHSKPYPTKAQAERKAAGWDHMGNCANPHEVVELVPDERGVLRLPDGRMVE